MTTIRVTRKKRPDPLQSEIDRRLRLKWAAEQRRASGRPIAAVETLRDLAAHLRAHPIAPLAVEMWP